MARGEVPTSELRAAVEGLRDIPREWAERILRLARTVEALCSHDEFMRERKRTPLPTVEFMRILINKRLQRELRRVPDYLEGFQEEYGLSLRDAVRQAQSTSGWHRLCNMVEWDSRWLNDPRIRAPVRAKERRRTKHSQRLVKDLYTLAARNRHLPEPAKRRSRAAERLVEGLELLPHLHGTYTKQEAERLRKLSVRLFGWKTTYPTTHEELLARLAELGLLPENAYKNDRAALSVLARHSLI